MKILLVLSLFLSVVICTTGVDVSTAVSSADFSCLVKEDYTFAIIRCFQSTGQVDPNCASNVANAHSAGMENVDIYMFPCFKCGNPQAQMDALSNYTKTNGVKYNTLWLDIEGTQYWGTVSANTAFFQSLVNAGEHSGQSMGVYTSSSQWTPIMGTSTTGSDYPIWYAHYDGVQSFSDFTAFGGWKTPTMKQYGGDKTTCGISVDYDWVPDASTTTGSATHATSGPATHATSGPATHATTHATSGPATHATNGPATHATSGHATSGHATSGHATNGPATHSTSGPSSTSGTTSSYSSDGDSSSSGDFSFLDRALYNAGLGGNKIPVVQENQENQERALKKSLSIKFAEVEDALQREEHFKVVEEQSFNKF